MAAKKAGAAFEGSGVKGIVLVGAKAEVEKVGEGTRSLRAR